MASSSKKLGLGGILELLGAVLGVVALILMIVCNSMGTEYEFTYATLLNLGAIAGAVLAVVVAFSPRFSFDKKGYLGLTAAVGSVFLYGFTAIQAVNERILVISSLFSWNTGNTAGWTSFYFTIAVVVCLVLASILVIVGAFVLPAGESEDSPEVEAAVE